jgi:hypothetical protein
MLSRLGGEGKRRERGICVSKHFAAMGRQSEDRVEALVRLGVGSGNDDGATTSHDMSRSEWLLS